MEEFLECYAALLQFYAHAARRDAKTERVLIRAHHYYEMLRRGEGN